MAAGWIPAFAGVTGAGGFSMVKPESTVQRVLQEIADRETVSIRLLARQLGIQPQSLLGKLRPLLKKGLVVLSEGRAKVGINPDFGQVVGIDLGASISTSPWLISGERSSRIPINGFGPKMDPES